ncbi:hypothetical protein Efla_001950 [Eimeria flavescens]
MACWRLATTMQQQQYQQQQQQQQQQVAAASTPIAASVFYGRPVGPPSNVPSPQGPLAADKTLPAVGGGGPQAAAAAATAAAAAAAGDTVFRFGKFAGKTFACVAARDSSYCRWALGLPAPTGQLAAFVAYLQQQQQQQQQPAPVEDLQQQQQQQRQQHPGGTQQQDAARPQKQQRQQYQLKLQLSPSRSLTVAAAPAALHAVKAASAAVPAAPVSAAATAASAAAAAARPAAQLQHPSPLRCSLPSPGDAAAAAQGEGDEIAAMPMAAAAVVPAAAAAVAAVAAVGHTAVDDPASDFDFDMDTLGDQQQQQQQQQHVDAAAAASAAAACTVPPAAPASFDHVQQQQQQQFASAAVSPLSASRVVKKAALQHMDGLRFCPVPSLSSSSSSGGMGGVIQPGSSTSSNSPLSVKPFPVAGSTPAAAASAAAAAAAPAAAAAAAADVAPSLHVETSVALEVCGEETFRVVALQQQQPRRQGGPRGGSKGALWSAALPRPLGDYLKALKAEWADEVEGPGVDRGLQRRKSSSSSSSSSSTVDPGPFAAARYAAVLEGLKKRFTFTSLDSIPAFVLRAFAAFQPFAAAAAVPKKTALVLLRHKLPPSPQLQQLQRLQQQQQQQREASASADATSAAAGGPAATPAAAAATAAAAGIEPSLFASLRDFQKQGVAFGLQRHGRVLIGDEMGLGKTIQALTIAAHYLDDWPLLVVCPSSIRFQWRDQALRWLGHILTPEQILIIRNGKTEILPETRMVIISYDLLAKQERFQANYQCVICDESHYLKNHQAKRTQAICPIIRQARRALLLSGTPALNRPVELYQQLNSLLPEFCSYREFSDRFCLPVFNAFTKKVEDEGHQHEEELHLLLKHTVMIRRLKQDVLKELPAKQRQGQQAAIST